MGRHTPTTTPRHKGAHQQCMTAINKNRNTATEQLTREPYVLIHSLFFLAATSWTRVQTSTSEHVGLGNTVYFSVLSSKQDKASHAWSGDSQVHQPDTEERNGSLQLLVLHTRSVISPCPWKPQGTQRGRYGPRP